MNPQEVLDKKLNYVSVLDLDTGEQYSYTYMNIRTALIACALQHCDGNFNTWEYQDKVEKMGKNIRIGKTGKVASFEYKNRCFATNLQ